MKAFVGQWDWHAGEDPVMGYDDKSLVRSLTAVVLEVHPGAVDESLTFVYIGEDGGVVRSGYFDRSLRFLEWYEGETPWAEFNEEPRVA